MLRGAHALGYEPVAIKTADQAHPEEDWWKEYVLDHSDIKTMADWREFRDKWWSWLDDETIRFSMTQHNLDEFRVACHAFYHSSIQPAHVWMLQIINTMMFRIIELVRTVTRGDGEAPFRTWFGAFHLLASGEYIVEDQTTRRLYINSTKLEPQPWERACENNISYTAPIILRELEQQTGRDMSPKEG